MTDFYDKFIQQEDKIYSGMEVMIPKGISTGNSQLDYGLSWVCEGTETLLDFGCGNGSLMFECALRGVKELIGIDLSAEAIKLAKQRAELMTIGKYQFHHGSLEQLHKIAPGSVDSILLSNIIDNMLPEDARKVLSEANRIIKDGGRLFIKLNPYLAKKQIEEWNITVIDGNVLDDGLLLWNRTTEEWREMFLTFFQETEYIDIYFPEYEQYNRMFLLVK